MHLMGMYVHEAVAVALANAFRGKGDKPISYSDKPYEFLTETEAEERKRNADAERLKAAFMAFAERTKKRLEKDGNE